MAYNIYYKSPKGKLYSTTRGVLTADFNFFKYCRFTQVKDINYILDKISCKMHSRTGYSLRQAITEMQRNGSNKYYDYPRLSRQVAEEAAEFFNFNSDHWNTFLMFLNEASK